MYNSSQDDANQLFFSCHKGHKRIDKDGASAKIPLPFQQAAAVEQAVLLVLKAILQQRLIIGVDQRHLAGFACQRTVPLQLLADRLQAVRADPGIFKLVHLPQHPADKGGAFCRSGIHRKLVACLVEGKAHQQLTGGIGNILPCHSSPFGEHPMAQPGKAVHLDI